MRVYVSFPRKRKSEEEIMITRKKLTEKLQKQGDEAVFWDNELTPRTDEIQYMDLWILTNAIKSMSTCKQICMGYGWEDDRLCCLEKFISEYSHMDWIKEDAYGNLG